MKYKLIEKANPQDRDSKKWYANAVNQGTVGQREIAGNIAEKSSLTTGDIANVIENLLQEIPKELLKGKSVKLGDFGSFRLTLSSEGAATEKEFNTAMIKNVKVVFTPGTLFKNALSTVKFERD
ncbi:HU family DNA-binding protein [Bergeyella porcorum]|uniref:HU family DNA-binding protein n=1 Tax=Bergeyella porcorum TaxID=1735111 RepID=UPI0035E89895